MVAVNNVQCINHEMCNTKLLFENLIWTIDEVCKFTAYKKGTIYNLVSNGIIPYRKRGKRLFFIPCEILSWLKGE
ncbi:MAG: helix-turn-helix domain-containing protein [Bacteriovoracaceae bacterium]|nr:helix-turn-helix domain-containing protein [Bacteriovoracaceae bacterium]